MFSYDELKLFTCKHYIPLVPTYWCYIKPNNVDTYNYTQKLHYIFVFSAALWVCVVLAPHCGSMEKQQWQKTLEQWAQTDVCPLEDPDHRHQDNNDRVRTCIIFLFVTNNHCVLLLSM